MTHEEPMTAARPSKSKVIVGTVLAMALFLFMSYLVAQSSPVVTLPALSWTLAFTIALTARNIWLERREPPIRKRYVPGEMTINTAIIFLVGVFIMFFPEHADFPELLMANLWPLLLGSVTAILIAQIYTSVRVFRQ